MSILYGFGLLVLGLLAGVFSGLIGVGGGVILVPALVYIFKLSQHQAQGTTLALLVPPIGILGAITYYKSGYVDLKIAALICAGFILGGFFGAKVAGSLADKTLEKIFGSVLFCISLRMLLGK